MVMISGVVVLVVVMMAGLGYGILVVVVVGCVMEGKVVMVVEAEVVGDSRKGSVGGGGDWC